MLIPEDTSPPVTRNVATDVRLNLFTRYVLVCFQVLETNSERLSGSDKACHENFSDFGRFSSQYSIWMTSEYK